MSQTIAGSSDGNAVGLNAVRATLLELRGQRFAWEHDVAALFAEFDLLAEQMSFELAGSSRREGDRAEQECWRELAGRHEIMTKQQEAATFELSAMRAMIEQQTELLAAFVGAATQVSDPGKPRKSSGPDPVVSAVQAQFAQLAKPPSTEHRSDANRPGLARAG